MLLDPLVLVPPMLCDVRVFGAQLAGLSAEVPMLYAPTCQGERIEEIASQILSWAPQRFSLAGAGMGATVSLEILRRASDRVSRVALISGTAHGETPEGASAREPKIVAARSGRFDEVISEEMNTNWLSPSSPKTEIAQLIADMAWNQGPEAYVKQARALQRRRDHQATLRQINQPAWVICGADDSNLPVKRHEFTAEMIQNAHLHIVPGAGFLPTLEQPDHMIELLRRFIQS